MAAIVKGLDEAKRIGGIPEHIAVSTKEAVGLIRELNECKAFQKTNTRIKIESENGFNPKFLIFGSSLSEDKIEQFVEQIKDKQYIIYVDQVPILVDDKKSLPQSLASSKKTKDVN